MSDPRLHIGHFTNTYFPVVNGVVRSISTFRQAQVDLGHNVFVFAQDAPRYKDNEPFIFRYPSLNIPVRKYPVTLPVSPLIDWVLPILKLDVIHAHHPAPMGTAARDKAEKLGIPLIFTHHTRYQEYAQSMGLREDLVKDMIERLLADYMQSCHHIVVPSPSIKQMLADTYGIVERVTAVPTGIDLAPYVAADGRQVRRQRGWKEEEIVIISVGRLAREKNFQTLIRAAAVVMEQHPVRLALIGEGPAQKSLQELSEDLRIADRVEFVGSVPFAEMPAYLKAADLFAFASVTETQGLVTMEAMAAGLPVAAVEASGTSDIVRHEKNGLLTPNDGEKLSAAILRILEDAELAARLRAGTESTAEEYEYHTTARRLLDVYRQAIADKKAGKHVQPDKRKPIFKIDWDKLVEGFKLPDDLRQV